MEGETMIILVLCAIGFAVAGVPGVVSVIVLRLVVDELV